MASAMDNATASGPILLTSRPTSGSGGVAFEVPIKHPEGAKMSTPAKLRLEAYGTTRSPQKGERKAPISERRLRSEELAEKAREINEKVRLTAERVRIELDESAEAKRRDLEQDQEEKRKRRDEKLASVAQRLQNCPTPAKQPESSSRQQQLRDGVSQKIERASEKRRANLADRSTKAGLHFEVVLTRKEVCQQHRAEENAAHMKKLEEALAAKAALHDAGVAQRVERAGHHNEAVVGKVQKHIQEVQKHNDELLAKHRQKSGSKIDGRPHITAGEAAVAEEAGSSAESSMLASSVPRGGLLNFAARLAAFLPCPP